MIWLRFQQLSTTEVTPTRVRDTEDGRLKIAEAIARLRGWCERTETPWIPVAPPGEGA